MLLENDINFEMFKRLYSRAFPWFVREVKRYEFHPVIKEILDANFQPADMQLLVLQWPHQSLKDAQNIAYTQNSRSGVEDRQQVTTFGRFVRRHFPEMKDHEIRDYSTKCVLDEYYIRDTIEEIIQAAQEGPRSCMQWENSYPDRHPYGVYAPEYGWRIAVRIGHTSRTIDGRALVNLNSNSFVRTYKRGQDYSYADEGLEFWLKSQGFIHQSGWDEGTKLKHVVSYGDPILPYIDGDNQYVKYDYNNKCMVICDSSDAEYECCSTDGRGESVTPTDNCSYCGEECNEEDLGEVDDPDYRYDRICEYCRDHHFVCTELHGVYHEDNVVEVVSPRYDFYMPNHSSILSDHDIVEDINGDYRRLQDCYEFEDSGEYLYKDDFDESQWFINESGKLEDVKEEETSDE